MIALIHEGRDIQLMLKNAIKGNPYIILDISTMNGDIEALKIIMGWHALATGSYKYIVHLFLTIVTI